MTKGFKDFLKDAHKSLTTGTPFEKVKAEIDHAMYVPDGKVIKFDKILMNGICEYLIKQYDAEYVDDLDYLLTSGRITKLGRLYEAEYKGDPRDIFVYSKGEISIERGDY